MTQAKFGNGVVSRFVVSRCVDGGCKCFGHGRSVLRHMAHLPTGQPKCEEPVEPQQAGKNQGECESGSHTTSVGDNATYEFKRYK